MPSKQPAKFSLARTMLWFVFFCYSAVLVKIIVIKNSRFFMERMRATWRHGGYQRSSATQNWVPLRSIKNMLSGRANFTTAFENVGGNIIIFIPFGILVPLLMKGKYKFFKTLFLGFALSAFFEFFQLYTGCGQFDVDDIILNTAGTLAGLIFYGIGSLLKPAPKANDDTTDSAVINEYQP